jgi:hypothetical protein
MEKLKTFLSNTMGSTRFWTIIGIAAVGYIKGIALIDPIVADALVTILGGYVVVKTSQNFQYPAE